MVQHGLLLLCQFTDQLGEMYEFGIHTTHAGNQLLQAGKQLVASEIGKDGALMQDMHVDFGLGDCRIGKRRRIG